MAKRRHPIERLPKAPLAEVVFELRWTLQGPAEAPVLIKVDPGLLPLLDGFMGRMKQQGFPVFKDMSPALQTGGHGVVRRFFKGPDSPFPIMQVGVGIFAANESALYEWNAFKAQIFMGLRALLNSYPKISFFKLEPSFVELRYIDAFDKSLLGTAALFEFMERGMSVKLQTPKMLRDEKVFAGDAAGRVVFVRGLRGWKNSRFHLDITTAKKGGTEDIVRTETKVQCDGVGVPALKNPAKFMKDIDKWLEFAHGVTSPFFKELVLPNLMQKFKG